jgi:hypothetical protein
MLQKMKTLPHRLTPPHPYKQSQEDHQKNQKKPTSSQQLQHNLQQWKNQAASKKTQAASNTGTELTELTDAQRSCLKAFREQHVLWGQRSKVYKDLATAQHYRLTSATMALYLFVIHPELYKKATSALRAAGKKYPNPLISTHGHTATNPKFITTLQQKVCQLQSGFRV